MEPQPVQPPQQEPEPVSVEPETPVEQPMFDQEQLLQAHSSQVPDAFDPYLYEQEPETPWVHQGAPDFDEDLDAEEEQETPRPQQQQAPAPEPETPVVEERRQLRRSRYDQLTDVPTSIRQNLEARRRATTYDPLNVPHSIRRALQDQQTTKKPRVDEHLIIELSLKESVDFNCSTLYPARFRRVGLVKMRKAMASQWDKWLAFNAVRHCFREGLAQLKRKRPQRKIVGTRWILTEKDANTFKARLAVQGCQENDLGIRADAPTGSRDAFWLAARFAVQHGWGGAFFDARTADLQAEGIDRVLIQMPLENPLPGTTPAQDFFATGSIYSAKNARRAWYLRLKSVLREYQTHESKLERGWYYLAYQGDRLLFIRSCVGDMFFAWRRSRTYVLRPKRLHLAKKAGEIDYLGTNMQMTPGYMHVTWEKAIKAIEYTPIDANRMKALESEATPEEVSSFRTTNGQAQWVATRSRPDAACKQNSAQRISWLKVQDLVNLKQLVTQAKQIPTLGVRLVRGRTRVLLAQLAFYGDSAFANAEDERSQWGLVGGLTHKPEGVHQGNFDELIPLTWRPGRVWRVLTELKMAAKFGGPPKLKDVERQADNIKMTTFTDSKNLEEMAEKDAGIAQVTHVGMLMAFMSGRDVKFTAPAPKSKKLIQLLTIATSAVPGAGFELWPIEKTSTIRASQDPTILKSCSRESYAVSWLYYLQGGSQCFTSLII
ncbi:unnamed protein product [Prorocentrum cordatum]|uniref:Reverse transcriptase Ty1/copia-type domain-containing protein n=1 Tax=Prorocentrum cordatum TaxID=2364126 RepID=A0ABN9TCC6_9DINO|nr:unnamed protein product [Polarella glacialis]